MKASPTSKRPRRTRREQGIALVTVLAILTLTAVLVMAFFTISRSELASSTVYSRGVEASHLSKSAMDMVIHQIRSATDRKGTAWASQPGMVRTWQGETRQCYKLYSDETMVVSEDKVFDDFKDLAAWRNDVRFVDLNAPVIRTYDTRTEYFYPIIDPRAAIGNTKVEGFEVNFGAVGASPASRTLPMPVKWIYQLEDGTLGTLVGSGTKGQFQAIGGAAGRRPTADNPIVARFAFWADDETAKLNVNTAAGGVAWDTPRAAGVSDRAYGMFQPVANEFQRYPGHPATTSMMHVLFPGVALPNSDRYDRQSAEAYYDLIPRVQRGGSIGGGFAGTNNRYGQILPIQPDEDRLYATIDEFIFRAPQVGLSDGRTGVSFERQQQRKVGQWPLLRPTDLGRLQFFLTATSKAPEVTIFNTPRISVWPSYHGDPQRNDHLRYFTSYDRRLRFCAEVGKRDGAAGSDSRAPKDSDSREPAMYHFQRKNAASNTADYADIPRNRELYAYLQDMMSAPVPGMDTSDGVRNWNSFRNKYGERNANQIITEVFDYIRSLNLFDDLLMKQHGIQQITTSRLPSAPVAISRNFANNGYFGYWPPGAPNDGTHTTFTPGRLSVYQDPDLINGHAGYVGADTHTGHGQVAPIQITPPGGALTKGFGRFFSVREAGIAVLACAQDNGRPAGLSRKGVGVTNLGSTNEGWATTGVRVTGIAAGNPPRVSSDGSEPTWDYSNVPPLSQVTKPHVYNVYKLNQFTKTGTSGTPEPIQVTDLDNNTVQIPCDPPMGGLQFFNYVSNEANWNRTLQVDTPLTGGATQVQAILLVSLYSPSKGWTLINPDFRFEMDVQRDFGLNGQGLGFPMGAQTVKTPHAGFRRIWGGRDNGGILEPRMLTIGHSRLNNPRPDRIAYALLARSTPALLNPLNTAPPFGAFNADVDSPPGADPTEGPQSYVYPWVSTTMTIPGTADTQTSFSNQIATSMALNGGRLVIKLFPDGGSRTNGADPVSGKVAVENGGPQDYSQMVAIDFADTTVPLPILAGAGNGHLREGPSANQWTAVASSEARPREHWCWNRDGAFKMAGVVAPPGTNLGINRGRLQMTGGHQGYGISEPGFLTFSGHGLVRPVDVVRSYLIPHGDDRLVAAQRDLPASTFKHHVLYGNNARLVASNFTVEYGNQGYGREGIPGPGPNQAADPKALVDPSVANVPRGRRAVLPDNFQLNMNQWGDWDNGVAAELDGPMINKPDEGNAMGVAYNDYVPKPWITNSPARAFIPYFTDSWVQEPAGPGLWSPNRIMPGPGMLGSLPTGVYDRSGGPGGQPWQTLLFRRVGGSVQQSAQGQSPRTGNVHPGWEHPRDHYLLDFFWMPVVEPYSISEPLATAGKVNMNYAIQPFDYIKRKSSLLGVFSSEELLTVPNRLSIGAANAANAYKEGEGWGSGFNRTTNTGGTLRDVSLRTWINLDQTLRQFDDLFGRPGGKNRPQIFRTASQICEQWLVPGRPVRGNPFGVTNMRLEDVAQWYNPDSNPVAGNRSFGLVGDNVRERPYTNLIARLTTKSNTYNVHYRAQIIRQSPLSPVNPGQRRSDAEFATFDASTDKMVGEYRGSSIVERYIDPNDIRIPDYASLSLRGSLQLGNDKASVDTLDKFYRFRVVSEKRFAP
jgi:uncharacterized protein (TIGR02600 family)